MRVGRLDWLSVRLLAVSLIAAAIPLLGPWQPAEAAPGAPMDLSPSAERVSGAPLLSWARVKGVATYDVELSTSAAFTSAVYTVTTANTHATPTIEVPQGVDLYWRVRGVTPSQVHGAWAQASFTEDVTTGPELLTPLDGDSLQQPTDPPLLTWAPVTGAVSYTVELDTEDQFVDSTSYTATVPAIANFNPALAPDQTYYWHVKANLSGGVSSTWSGTSSFSIVALPAPELVSPAGGSQVEDAVLDWLPVPGAVSYDVRVSTDDQFNTLVDSVNVRSTRYARPNTLGNDQYWWEARAIDSHGFASPWSTSLGQFQRSWPSKPVLVYPADGDSVADRLYFEWNPIPHASQYSVDVSADPSFSPGSFTTCITAATTYTVGRTNSSLCRPGSPGVYYWRVRGIDGPSSPTVYSTYSQIHSFDWEPPLVTQVSPADGDTVDVPTMTWESYPQAERYRVTVMRPNGSVIASATTYALTWTPTGTTRLKASDGPFHWNVQALFNDGTSTLVPLFGSDWTFNVTGTVTGTGLDPLSPTSPDQSHSYRPPLLTWEPLSDATYYKVFVGAAGGASFTTLADRFPYPAATDPSTTFLKPGDYQWFVTGYATDGTPLSSGPLGYFTIDSLSDVTGMTLSLTGSGLDDPATSCSRALPDAPTSDDICGNLQQTPVLSWDAVPDASYYMIYLSRDRELTNLVYQPTSTLTQSTLWNPTDLLPDSQAGTAYYWVIRPCKAVGSCAADPTTATNAFDKRSNPVSGLTETEHDSDTPLPPTGPGGADDVPTFGDEVVFSWDDYLDTNQAGNERDVTTLPSTVEAKSYRVQVGPDPSFTAPATVTSPLLDQTSWSLYTGTLPEGPLYWRVQAIDASGNALSSSLARSTGGGTNSIEKRSPTPQLISPSNASTVSGTPFFTWKPLAYAAKYTIQVAKNGDTTFSPSNIAINLTSTSDATYVPTTTLPTAGSPYVWRVRRADADNRAGDWSAVRTFKVAAPAPTLVSPGVGDYQSATYGVFTWLPAAGASSYKFERRLQGSSAPQETRTTVGLHWAPTTTLPDGRYEWRVSSLDQAGNPIGSSPWQLFVVDATAPTVVQKTPVQTAKPTSSFVVNFSERVNGISFSTFAIFEKGKHQRIPATVTVTNHKTMATLNPGSNLKVGKVYMVKLLNGITDLSGLPLRPVSWTVTIKR